MKIPENYQIALDKFVDKVKKRKEVIGIFLTGSFVHSIPDKNSDLDVFIITNNSKFRERGNTWINGVEIEYFENPVKQIEYSFKKESKSKPHTAHMFVNSIILYEKGKELRNLIKRAKKKLSLPVAKLSKTEKELLVYHINDEEKDLEDAYLKKDIFTFQEVSVQIIKTCLEIFLKTKRLKEEKSKRLKEFLINKDRKFAGLYEIALLETNTDKKYLSLISLIRYCEKLLGGKRKKEWKLRSKCPYLKK